MQNIELSSDLDCALGGVTSMTSNKFIVYRHLLDVIKVLPRQYVHEFHALVVPTPPFQMKYFNV